MEGFEKRGDVLMTPACAEHFDSLPEEDQAALLPRLESETFRVLTELDLDQLPTTRD